MVRRHGFYHGESGVESGAVIVVGGVDDVRDKDEDCVEYYTVCSEMSSKGVGWMPGKNREWEKEGGTRGLQ